MVFLTMYVCSEEEVDQKVSGTIYYPQKQLELLTIYGNPVDEGECMFENGMYLSIFFFNVFLRIDQ